MLPAFVLVLIQSLTQTGGSKDTIRAAWTVDPEDKIDVESFTVRLASRTH